MQEQMPGLLKNLHAMILKMKIMPKAMIDSIQTYRQIYKGKFHPQRVMISQIRLTNEAIEKKKQVILLTDTTGQLWVQTLIEGWISKKSSKSMLMQYRSSKTSLKLAIKWVSNWESWRKIEREGWLLGKNNPPIRLPPLKIKINKLIPSRKKTILNITLPNTKNQRLQSG